MDKSVEEYIRRYSDDIQALYISIRKMIMDDISLEAEEKLWAKLPSYYVGDKFIRLIPFKDHINIEASAVLHHRDELVGFKITSKGMLQVYLNQIVPTDVLSAIINETLSE